MVASSGRKKTRAAIVAGSVALALWACATSEIPNTNVRGAMHTLTDVRVDREGDRSVVTLVGLYDPMYSAFQKSDPRMLVLDISEVEIDAASNLVTVYDGIVEHVTLSPYADDLAGPMARVEIALSVDSDWEVENTSVGLALWLTPHAGADELASADGEELQGWGEDPWADPDPEPVSVEMTDIAFESVQMSTPATTLLSVSADPMAGGVLLHLVADGVIGATEAFALDDPPRLVVDLPGLKSEVESDRLRVDSVHVSFVRIGAHPDRVRVVLDGGSAAGSFDGRRLTPASNGLFVSIGSGVALDLALAQGMARGNASHASSWDDTGTLADDAWAIERDAEGNISDDPWTGAEAAGDSFDPSGGWVEAEQLAGDTAGSEEPVAERDWTDSGAIQIYGIHYDSQEERDRIAVLSDSLVDYEVHTPDAETVVVSLFGSWIAPEASGRIAPRPGGPVSLIRAFQQPDVMNEVRLVVTRASGIAPEVMRRGSILFVDFPNTGVAALPPVFMDLDPGERVHPFATHGTSQVGSELEMDAGTPAESAEVASEWDLDTGSQEVADFVPVNEAMPALESDYADLPAFTESEAFGGPAGFDRDLAPSAGPVAPASLEPPAAVDILREGGIMDGKKYAGRRISLDFKDVAVADVLRLIAEVSDLNIIAGDEVKGNVTIRLVEVPWDQALDVILLTKGLGFVRIGNVLRIAPSDILQAEQEVRLQERRNKEKLEDLVLKLLPVNYADVEDMEDLVKRVLSARGTVNTDQRTNTLIIKDISAVVDEATALVKAVDTQTPQVLIEAKIVEANLDFARELGSFWSIGSQPLIDGFDPGSGPRRDLGGQDYRLHGTNSVVFGNTITSLATGLGSFSAFLADEKIDLNVQIQAAEASGEGKVISSPRIVTLDNTEASIEQGVSIPFQTFESGDAKLEFIDAVLSLLVTPHITADRSIIMDIEVTKNAPDDTVPTPTGSPAIAKNVAKTKTLVKDGQTLVIGGIYTITKTERQSRVPYLHRLPIFGVMFKSKEITDQRKELLIFVTPRIIVTPELAAR